jgi:hypothetical protein
MMKRAPIRGADFAAMQRLRSSLFASCKKGRKRLAVWVVVNGPIRLSLCAAIRCREWRELIDGLASGVVGNKLAAATAMLERDVLRAAGPGRVGRLGPCLLAPQPQDNAP